MNVAGNIGATCASALPTHSLTHSLTHEVLISLRSNDYFVGTPIDDEAIGEVRGEVITSA